MQRVQTNCPQQQPSFGNFQQNVPQPEDQAQQGIQLPDQKGASLSNNAEFMRQEPNFGNEDDELAEDQVSDNTEIENASGKFATQEDYEGEEELK